LYENPQPYRLVAKFLIAYRNFISELPFVRGIRHFALWQTCVHLHMTKGRTSDKRNGFGMLYCLYFHVYSIERLKIGHSYVTYLSLS